MSLADIDLSIIIPVKDRPGPVTLLLNELVRQIETTASAGRVELIVIDDGSAIPVSVGPDVPCVVQRMAVCCGAAQARMAGFAVSRGRYIHFHDSDDGFSPDWLERVLAWTGQKEFDMLFTARRVRSRGQDCGRRVEPQVLQRLLAVPQRLRCYLTYQNCIGPLGGVVFSRRTVEAMTFPPMASCQDWLMYWQGLGVAEKLQFDGAIWFLFNTMQNDRISSSFERKRSGINSLVEHFGGSILKRTFVSKMNILGASANLGKMGPVAALVFNHGFRPFLKAAAHLEILLIHRISRPE